MSSKEIREKFLDFFASKNHVIVPSAPMVVKNDPTLMFTNAGMNQFKDCFLGNSPITHPRIADTQKCLRVSGKHNDLEEVGHDSYHHTMFEMLGNWSFGDYFKEKAIEWAWELLTEVYKLNPDDLYASVFEGSKEENLEMDSEAKGYWLKFLPEERIILGNKKDNFWEMGDTGPCGPCSEIHIDLRSDKEKREISGAKLVNQGHPLVIEIWNLVFMQFNRKANGSLEPLPLKHIDTGMGLERLIMAINKKESTYECDIFQNIIKEVENLSGKKYNDSEKNAVAMKVIADHIRAISFSIADGQLPSNVKAGYVIRRILRRAVRYGYTFLGFNTPFLCKLVPVLVKEMGSAFPELISQQTLIEKVIKEEEEAFLRTLDKGINLITAILEKNKESKLISGKDAFTLYDTFGFPIDLSELIAKENGYTIDIHGFEAELAKQKERARSAATVEEGDWVELRPFVSEEFVGYDELESDILIMKHRVVKSKNKEVFQLVFDRSPFYAESGGQVGDSGVIISETGETINIINTVKENNLNIHFAEKIPTEPLKKFRAKVNIERREEIANNHSATHLLHFALRSLLGTHIEQKGSYVSPEYFRFDFSHFEKLTDEQITQVEMMVNRLIRSNITLKEFRAIPIGEAQKMGAMALFGEKYGESVRVIKFGESIELCGGTHTSATGNIGFFKIISEGAIAAGVRRIEATTGKNAEYMIYGIINQIKMVQEIIGQSPDIINGIKKLLLENEEYKKEIEKFIKERVAALKKQIVEESKESDGIRCFSTFGIYHSEIIKNLAFELYKEYENSLFVAAYETPEGKPSLVLTYSKDLVTKGYDAAKDIKEAAKIIQGGGGGQPFLATAGGKNKESLSEAFAKLLDLATKK